jgi:arabinose-5-phosphate isomerase
MSYLEWGREVISLEIEALTACLNRLDKSFTNAAQYIKNCKGKVIITGLGKSGHIGRKISATMSSLGTPSVFLHSVEGLHGDMGIIQKSDILIAISNSGKTEEVVKVAQKSKEIGLKTIVFTGNVKSPLAGLADIIIDISVEKEADHLNLAPTSSSTITLAVGDALAVAVAKAKNLSAQDFAFVHAGGSLGKKSKQAK